MLMAIFVPGLLISFGQWAILRTRFRKLWGWIIAIAICLPVGVYIVFLAFTYYVPLFGNFLDTVHDYSISGCFAGLTVGLFQWLSLQTKSTGMLTWLPVSILSWGIGIALPMFAFNSYMSNNSSALRE